MAYTSREIMAPASDVFDVLTDPYTYPSWLIGAAIIRSVDDNWPEVGSRFHHSVGFGPFVIPDDTKIEAIVPGSLLRLRVRARPLVLATATFELVDGGSRCVVMLEEEPRLRVLGNMVRPVLDPMTHMRNHVSLRRLAEVVEERQLRDTA
jgi:uncharacterized protein YndB with AHSA1/START domain